MARRKAREENKISYRKIAIAAVFCLIIINALYYAFSHYEGISEYGDDPNYVWMAGSVLNGNFKENPGYIFSVRLVEAYAIAGFFYLFGINSLTASLWNITSYVGIVVVTFLIVRLLYDEKAALLSAFIVSIFPLVAKYAVNIGEDIPFAFISGLAILLFLYAERFNKKHFYFFSGALIVASWLISYEAGIVILFIFAYAIIEILRKKIKIDYNSIFFVYGILIAFLLVFIFSYFNSGLPFITITTNSRFYSAVGGSINGLPTIPTADMSPSFYINGMFQYGIVNTFMHNSLKNSILTVSNMLFAASNPSEYGIYFYIAIPILVLLLLFKERRSYFLIFWFAFMFLMLEFGPMHMGLSFNPFSITYVLAHRLLRFMLIIAVPTAGIIGIGLAKLLEFRNKLAVASGIIALVCILALIYANSYYIAQFWYNWQNYPNQLVMQAANYIKTVSPTSNIYLEGRESSGVSVVAYSVTPIGTYLGNPDTERINYWISANISCSYFENDSYIIWAGPAHCPDWVNELNITTPKDIPDYIINSENPSMGYIITNIYYKR
jgi:4-amino-4-deoxy-L-arabinose transferase-like glycosyltransferase